MERIITRTLFVELSLSLLGFLLLVSLFSHSRHTGKYTEAIGNGRGVIVEVLQ